MPEQSSVLLKEIQQKFSMQSGIIKYAKTKGKYES